MVARGAESKKCGGNSCVDVALAYESTLHYDPYRRILDKPFSLCII